MAEAFLREFGGPVGVAKAAKLVFDDRDTSAAIKARIVSDMMFVIKSANALEPPPSPDEGLTSETTEEMERETSLLLKGILDGSLR